MTRIGGKAEESLTQRFLAMSALNKSSPKTAEGSTTEMGSSLCCQNKSKPSMVTGPGPQVRPTHNLSTRKCNVQDFACSLQIELPHSWLTTYTTGDIRGEGICRTTMCRRQPDGEGENHVSYCGAAGCAKLLLPVETPGWCQSGKTGYFPLLSLSLSSWLCKNPNQIMISLHSYNEPPVSI